MCERAREWATLCTYIFICIFMFDVRIFSTFYIRTKLDFLLHQLSSLFYPSLSYYIMRYWTFYLLFFFSGVFFSGSYSEHTQNHSLSFSHAAKQITSTYLSRSLIFGGFFLFILVCRLRAWPFLSSTLINTVKSAHIQHATFICRRIWKSLYVCKAFHTLNWIII